MAIFLDRVDQIIREVFLELQRRNNRATGKEVLAAIEPRLNLTDYEKEATRTGSIRWETVVRFYTIDCVKAGYLEKRDGMWILTDQGAKALSMKPGELIRSANKKYRAWDKSRQAEEPRTVTPEAPDIEVERQAAYEQASESAREEINEYINDLDPYDFQNLVAELLSAMGYYIRRIAPPGPDGGIDILAYRDQLGTLAPRVHVQVKHRDQKVGAKEVRELEGLLRRDGDIGLIVSSGGFTSESEREIRSSTKHIDTMDQDRLVKLWQDNYKNLSEPAKKLLPLTPVYFLAPPTLT